MGTMTDVILILHIIVIIVYGVSDRIYQCTYDINGILWSV